MKDTDQDELEQQIDDLSCSMDSDERDFIENISWDTESSEGDVEYDNTIIDEVEADQELKKCKYLD